MRKPEPPPIKPPRVLLTAEQVAEILIMSVSTLEKWRYQRKGPPATKVGSLVRYEKSALDAWIDAQAVSEIPQASGQ